MGGRVNSDYYKSLDLTGSPLFVRTVVAGIPILLSQPAKLKIQNTSIAGVHVVETMPLGDSRGIFARLFCDQELAPILGHRKIAQINFSRTMQEGAIRGLHFQYPPHAELKMVRCLRGRVWDVVVDVRESSPTFLQWHAEELTESNWKMLVIPEGCAHGFQVLSSPSELLYLHTAPYERSAEGALRYDDPALGIRWPLALTDLSARDSQHAWVDSLFRSVRVSGD